MGNSITLNIVEPGSPTPDPVVPNTGLFTSGIGGPEATAIGAVLILSIAAIVVAFLYRKQKKSGKVTKLVHLVDSTRAILKSKKRITAGLSAIALLASAGTLTTLLASANKNNTNAVEGDGLTLDVTGGDITIEVGDEPVFAVAEVKATVKEATEVGYTLTAYTDNTDLVSTTDETKTIPMVAVEGDELAALTDNTYGLALGEEPTTKDAEVYTPLSVDSDAPTILKATDFVETEANDTTTIYYGFYITPDTPYGTYTSSDITYDVEANEVATVVYDGNGLYFNGDESQTTNTAEYVVETTDNTEKYSHTPNVTDEGVQEGDVKYNTFGNNVITIPGAASVKVNLTYGGGYAYNYQMGYMSFWQGAHPDYRANVNYETGIQKCGESTVTDGKYYTENGTENVECTVSGDSVTFDFWSQGGGPGGVSWYGYYAIVTGYDADGNIIYLPENNIISGDYQAPASDSYYRFLGWSKSSESTAPEYATEDDIKSGLALTLGETTTLYAVWEPAFTISYNGNGADSTTNMDNVEQYTTDLESTEKQVDLLASNFKKEGYGFAGWSTDQDAASKINNTGDDKPTIYGPNQMITVDPSASTKLNLYAVWVPAETNVTMQTFNPNSEPYASKPNGTVIALKDERDEEVYAVAKLADGNYWMIENLRLDNEPELSATNTHSPSLPLTNDDEDRTTSNYLSATSNDWCYFTWSDPEQDALCANQSKLNTNNVTNTATSPSFSQDFTNSVHDWSAGSLDANIASYGNYYNWYSATAGNGTYSTGEQGAETVAGDICPAGWILPIGDKTDAKGSFSRLDTSMGGTGEWQGSTEASNRWRSFPNNFVYSGYWYGSSAGSRGNYGYYWSSTAGDTSYAYSLYFNSDYVNPGTDGNGKYYGFSVRCVAPVEQ